MTWIYPGSVRLIVHPSGEGGLNMAVDETLLHRVEDGQSPPVLRLYGFSPPTLSVGRFQRLGEHLDLALLERDGITLVRRPTGGQAVLHDQELTYAVILAKDHVNPFSKREIYHFVAQILLEGLSLLGIQGVSNREQRGGLRNPDCFRSSGEYEIANPKGRKLVGSAQVYTRNGVLQHGAIPLNNSYRRIARYLQGSGREQSGRIPEASGRFGSSTPSTESTGQGFRSPNLLPESTGPVFRSPNPLPESTGPVFRAPGSLPESTVPAPGSLEEELGREVSIAEVEEAVIGAFQARMGVKRDSLNPQEWELARTLCRNKYKEEEWNLQY